MPETEFVRNPEDYVEAVALSGMVAEVALNAVSPELKALETENSRWFHLRMVPEGTTARARFDWAFDVSWLGGFIPLYHGEIVVRDIHTDMGNYYDLPFYRDHPVFKKQWGWKPIGLVEFSNGIPQQILEVCGPEERWQQNTSPVFLSDAAFVERIKAAALPRDLEFLQNYLGRLGSWLNAGNHYNTFGVWLLTSFQPGGSQEMMPGQFFRFEPVEVGAWRRDLTESCVSILDFSPMQAEQLITYLDEWWRIEPTHIWRGINDDNLSRGHYAIGYEYLVFEVNGSFYWLQLRWSD